MQIGTSDNLNAVKICHAAIDLKTFLRNIFFIQSHSFGAETVAMVKANAYGHGLATISQVLQAQGIKRFGVATMEEAIALRQADINGTILLMGGSELTQNIDGIIDAEITPLVSSLEELQICIGALRKRKLAKPFQVHLDLDTGMSRSGILVEANPESNLKPIVHILKKNTNIINLGGVSTHFANAEIANCPFTKLQLHLFLKAITYLDHAGFSETTLHASKSSAILTKQGLGPAILPKIHQHSIWIRPGIALYGVNSLSESNQLSGLSPILSWRTPVTVRKTILKGTPVGYNNTWTAKQETEIAILRVGYGDGYHRQLSNIGHVIIQGQKAPIVGRISMDLTAIDVTQITKKLGTESCKTGSMATLIGSDGDKTITVQDLSKLCHTIPYEILANISTRVKRIYF
jgi:alanine racemase